MIKAIALVSILIFRLTGFWPQLPAGLHLSLNQAGANTSSNLATTPTPVPPLPIQTSDQPLKLDAVAAMAVDTATSTPLFAQNADAKRPIASLTKLVTALVILSRHPLDQTVIIPKLPAYDPADEIIGLKPGEVYSEQDLLSAMLIGSEDDAADALALADSGTQERFATLMNTKMAEWGIADTHFSNPSGLTDTGNYATAAALVKIAQLALASPFIRQTVAEAQTTITSRADRVIPIATTNQLLASNQFYGIKTGYTQAAGECFVGLTRIDGHEVITVVLGAGDRFGATTTLTNWIGQTWQWL